MVLIKYRKYAQASLELAVVFASVALFFVGTVRMWVWSNAQLVGRSQAYDQTRLAAGQTDEYAGYWGNGTRAQSLKNAEGIYDPKELTDDWVFASNPSTGEQSEIHLPSSTPSSLAGAPHFVNWESDYDLEDVGDQAFLEAMGIDLDEIADDTGYGDDADIDADMDQIVDEVDDLINSVDLTDCSSIETTVNDIDDKIAEVEDSKSDLEDQLSYWQDKARVNDYNINNTQWRIDDFNEALDIIDSGSDPTYYQRYCWRCPDACQADYGSVSAADEARVRSCLQTWITRYTQGYGWVRYQCDIGGWTSGEAYSTGCFPSCTISTPCGNYAIDDGGKFDDRTEMAESYYTFYDVTNGYSYDTVNGPEIEQDIDGDGTPDTTTEMSWFELRTTFYEYIDYYKFLDNPEAVISGNPGYKPGLLDYQARDAYLSERIEDFESGIEQMEETIYQLEVQKYNLLVEARDLGCSFIPDPFPPAPVDPDEGGGGWSFF